MGALPKASEFARRFLESLEDLEGKEGLKGLRDGVGVQERVQNRETRTFAMNGRPAFCPIRKQSQPPSLAVTLGVPL